jgi:hypothetical protein
MISGSGHRVPMHAAFIPYLLCARQVNKEYLHRLGSVAVKVRVVQPSVAVPEPVSGTHFHFFQHLHCHGCLQEPDLKGRSQSPFPYLGWLLIAKTTTAMMMT